MDIRVTRAALNDVNRLLPLFVAYLEFYEQDHPVHRAHDFLEARMAQGDCVVFLAEAGDEAVGFTLLYPGFDSVYLSPAWTLHDLYVAQAFRRHGVARLLMETAHAHCRAAGAGRVDLATAVTNTIAQPLYESLGYERDDEFYYYSLSLQDEERQ